MHSLPHALFFIPQESSLCLPTISFELIFLQHVARFLHLLLSNLTCLCCAFFPLFSLLSYSQAYLAGAVLSLLHYQITMGHRSLIFFGKWLGHSVGQAGCAALAIHCPEWSLFSFLGLEAYCLIKILRHSGFLSFR